MKMMRLLFCTLLLAVLPQGVLLAQEEQNDLPVSGHVYKITNIHDGWTFGENANGTLVNQALAGTETATQLWLCVKAGDRYAFVNASSGRCLNSGSSWTTQKNAEYFYLVEQGKQADNATYGKGKTVYNITTSSTAAGSTCLHCYSAIPPKNYTGEGGGSRWTFAEATDVTLDDINASLAEYMASLVTAKATFASAVDGVSVTPLTLTATKASTDNPSAQNYLWSNAPHDNLSNSGDLGGCLALLDGNPDTFFHSRFNGTNINEYHYLQINNITGGLTTFRLHMTSRDGNNKPTELLISGSTDGINFVPITTLRKTDYTPLFAGSGKESYVSKVLSTGTAYNYLRFTVKQTRNNDKFGSYPFFTLAEFAIDKVTGTANSALADYAFKYATLDAAVTAAWGEATEMSATFLPAYYTLGDLDAVNTAVNTAIAALTNSVGDGTPDLELVPMDYYVYYTNERGERKYLSINANTHAVELSNAPAVFTFTKSTPASNEERATSVSTNAFIMKMNGYHFGHWNGTSAFIPEDNNNGSTSTSPWHAQAFYYDANHAKLAIRNTNATGTSYYAHYFIYVDPNDGNLKGVASTDANAHLLYQWTVQPVYPFALNGEKKYFIKTRVGTNDRRLLRMNLTENNVPLAEGKNSTSDAYWQFAQAESYGHHYVRIIPCVNTAKVLSYQASGVGNGDNKFTARDADASGYQQNFLLGSTGNAGAPYYFKVPGKTFYMSNIYGKDYKMGFYNELNDAGSRFAIIEVPENARFYRLKGHISGNYMDASDAVGSQMSMKPEDECSATGSVFYLTADNKLLSLHNGLYLKDTFSQTAQGAAAGNTLTIFPSERDVEGKYTLYTNFSGDEKYVSDNADKVGRKNAYAPECNWTLEPVTSLPVNISSVGWATFFAPVPIHIPAEGDLAAYTVTVNENKGTCTLNPVKGDIPAETGLVLRKHHGGLVYIDIAQSGTRDVSTNSLTGTIETIANPGNYTYALQRSVDQQYVGLFLYEGNIPGFRSYYYHSANSHAMRNGFVFNTDGPSTAITEVPDAMPQVQQGIYDLSGRRVSQPTRGIYIVGGKKTIIR